MRFRKGSNPMTDKNTRSNNEKRFRGRTRWISAGAAVLSFALCAPAAMLAQNSTPPQNSGETPSAQGQMPMRHRGMRHHKMTAQDQLNRLTKELNLTQDQQQKMLPILEDAHNRMQAIGKQMREVMQDSRQKLEAQMTASQKEKFQQKMEQRRGHMKQHRHSMNGHQGMGAQGSAAPQQ
jgi:Spy/CpxP family protein refolding chaperone